MQIVKPVSEIKRISFAGIVKGSWLFLSLVFIEQ